MSGTCANECVLLLMHKRLSSATGAVAQLNPAGVGGSAIYGHIQLVMDSGSTDRGQLVMDAGLTEVSCLWT